MFFPALFALTVGVGMIGQWVVSYQTGKIPELKTEPIRIGFHIAAEMCTAAALIAGGILLMVGVPAGRPLYLVASGMLFYTCIVSPGYFAQQGNWAWLGMFSALITTGIIAVFFVL